MLATINTPIALFKKALYFTVYYLEAVADLGADFNQSDRDFFRAESKKLLPFVQAIFASERALEDFELGAELRLQARVVYGDKVLDDGYRTAKATAKTELKFSSGLGHEHAFGADATDVTEAAQEVEPRLVLEVVKKLAELPEFASRERLGKDLSERAAQQQQCLEARAKSRAERASVDSRHASNLDLAAKALAQTRSALELRFPKNKALVAPFFYDVAPTRKKKLDKRVAAIFAVLEARGVAVDAETSKRLEGEASATLLDAWLSRAAQVASAAALFVE